MTQRFRDRFLSLFCLFILACLAGLNSSGMAAPSASLVPQGFGPATGGPKWAAYGNGFTVDEAVRHTDRPSARCEADAPGETTGALCSVTLNQKAATPVFVTGWSRAEGVDGSEDSDYSLYVDLIYQDGSPLWGQTATFSVGTHGWERRSVMILPARPLRSMNVYALFRNHVGKVWFADVTAQEVPPGNLFDGQALAPPAAPAASVDGWFVRDVAAGTPLIPLRPGHPALGILLEGLRTEPGGVAQGSVRNLTSRSRAVSVYYVRRVALPSPVWWNDIRSAVPIRPGREYANLTAVDAGATGKISLYPFCCVTGQGRGLALGVPPGLAPRVTRFGYHPDSHLLYTVSDLALTAHGDVNGHDRAPVSIVCYPVDPVWGFRSAAEHYYALFPEAFRRRAHQDGIWMPFTSPATIPHVADFHFAYHEGDNSVVSDRAEGILSFRYVEPMTYWMPMPKTMPRTYPAAWALVNQLASASTDPSQQRQAQAVLASGSWNAAMQSNVEFRDAPWCDGAVWILNPDPRLPDPHGLWTKARLNAAGEPVPGAPDQPDGEYLDSLESWADVPDYRPASLQATAAPLTFMPNSFQPVLPTWFSVYEAAAALSADLHRHDKLLMANTVLWRFWAFAPLLDVLGTETNMFSDTGAWQPDSDAVMNLRRTMSDHKPYLLLLNTDFTKTDSAKIALYFQRCLFYDIYPSMFSANAATHPYWEDPRLYERDRPLFKTYIPLIQKLSKAGWEPVTWAWTNRSDVWVERYGRRYLTVLNSGSAPEDVVVQIAAGRLAPNSTSAKLGVRDLMAGALLADQSSGKGTVAVSLHLAPSETRVLALAWSSP